MTYVYDLILNFHQKLYDFYEWEKDDKIYHIKRIYLMKISSSSFNDLLDYQVTLDNDFMFTIFNKCEYFENRNILTIPYAFLVTDTYRVMALMLDINGNVIKYSSLLLDEEEDVLDVCHKLGEIKLNYQKKEKKDICDCLTRREKHIIQYIKKDLIISYENKDIQKLKYLYYEYFNKQENNLEKIYQALLKELNNLNEKHYILYNLIKLSYSHKSV